MRGLQANNFSQRLKGLQVEKLLNICTNDTVIRDINRSFGCSGVGTLLPSGHTRHPQPFENCSV
jgi:hypothetical protein